MRSVSALGAYVTGVTVFGGLLVVGAGAGSVGHTGTRPWLLIGCLAAALAFLELRPVRTSRNGKAGLTIATSGPFVIALMVVAPLWVALLAHAVPQCIDSIRAGARWYKCLFSAAITGVAIVTGRAMFALASGEPFYGPTLVGPGIVLAIVAGGLTLFVVNAVLLAIVFALRDRAPLSRYFKSSAISDLVNGIIETSTAIVGLAAATVFSPFAVLFLAPSVLAVWKSVRDANQLQHFAFTDQLTDLPNSNYVKEHLLGARAEFDVNGQQLALIRLDLVELRHVNRTLGVAAGNTLLKQVADRLRSVQAEGQVVARAGADDFLLAVGVSPGKGAALDASEHAARLIDVLQDEPFVINGDAVLVEVRAGIVLCPDHGDTADVLLANVELALDKAKETRFPWAMYDPTVDSFSPSLLGELREAITAGQLILHYQPKVDLGTEAVRSVEALVRWQHPTRGLLFPDAFIDVAEKSHLIRDLTWNVLDQALAQAAAWRAEGKHIAVAVNMSALHLSEATLPRQVREALTNAGVPADSLILEMTEGSLMRDPEGTIGVLQELRDLGVRIAMDDYGTGYSSLSKLTALPLDELKIDRCFIGTIESDPGKAIITQSTIELAHAFGMKIVAEGAETPAGIAMLAEFGCDTVQGYYYSRPVPAERLNEWLTDRPVPGPDGELFNASLENALTAILTEAGGPHADPVPDAGPLAAGLPAPREADPSEQAVNDEEAA